MTQERHLAVKRTARYYVLGDVSPLVEDLWFACHGYGQLAGDFVKEFECIADPKRLIVVPEALSRYYIPSDPGYHTADTKVGATWMTREDREAEIADYVAYLDDLCAEIINEIGNRPIRVTVLGFSQGGATANRWVTRGNVRPDRLLMWGSFLPNDSDLLHAAEFFRTVKLVLIHGTRDQFADSKMIEKYEALLKENQIPFEAKTFGGGHRMDRSILQLLAE